MVAVFVRRKCGQEDTKVGWTYKYLGTVDTSAQNDIYRWILINGRVIIMVVVVLIVLPALGL
jgi:hypothetical protein